MITPGKFHILPISKIVDFGVYLDAGDNQEILLPMKWVPENCKPDDEVEVFVYFDSEDRLIATTMKPFAVLNDFAFMRVKAVNNVGAFLDWGLDKDLLWPYREQSFTVEEGKWYVVCLFADHSGRIAASDNLKKFISMHTNELQKDEEVDLLIYASTDLGYKAIVNNQYEGLLYANEIFTHISRGMKVRGFIKQVREDGKLDLTLYKAGYKNKIEEFAALLVEALDKNNGYLLLNDRSSPEEIYNVLGISKKNFKMAVGSLLKSGYIKLDESGIRRCAQ